MSIDIEEIEETYIPPIKTVLGFACGIGVGLIVGSSVNALAPQTKIFRKLVVNIAKAGIASAVSIRAVDAINSDIDDLVGAVKSIKNDSNQTAPESE